MQRTIKRIVEWDYNLTKQLRLNKSSKFLWWITTVIAHSGDSWYCLSVLLLVWLFVNNGWRSISAAMGLGTFVLAIVVLMIKFLIKRKRPEGDWGDIYRSTDPHSFPSGHATRVFFLATLAWGLAPVWLAVILTIWAPLVALSRILTSLHYVSDVLAGIILGVIIGRIFLIFVPILMTWLPWAF